MRSVFAILAIFLAGCIADPADVEPTPESTEQALSLGMNHHAGRCLHPPPIIANAFDTFDAQTSPPPLGQPASVTLGPWLDYLSEDVEFQVNNDPDRIGRAATAQYFDPLLPVIGTVVHDLDTVSPICEDNHAWSVRGDLILTRRSDGQPIQTIHFTDAFFLNKKDNLIERYEIRFDPTPLGQLFAP